MPVPGLPSAFVTVPDTVTVVLGAAGLGVAVSVTVALGGPTWRVLGADVLPARVAASRWVEGGRHRVRSRDAWSWEHV